MPTGRCISPFPLLCHSICCETLRPMDCGYWCGASYRVASYLLPSFNRYSPCLPTEGWPGWVTKTSYLRWSLIQVLINWARRRVTWFIVTIKTISQLILIYKFVQSATKSTTFVSLNNFGKYGPHSIILSTLLARPAILSSKFGIYIGQCTARLYGLISGEVEPWLNVKIS